jgi:hypothetical protein
MMGQQGPARPRFTLRGMVHPIARAPETVTARGEVAP